MDNNNAFERAKAAYGTGAYDDATLEFLFPELKESEDERIRKSIVTIVNQYARMCEKEGDPCEASLINDALAYLERQKEQKPANVSEKIEELCSKYPLNKDVMSEETLSAYHQGLTFGATRIAEYLGEQKPAEWSEEDKEKINALYNAITLLRDLVHTGELKSTDRYKVENYYEELASWLKSLRPQSHWKPSEEQMDAMETIINSTHNPNHDICILRELYNDLKKL